MRRIGAKAALWFLVPALAFSLGLGAASTVVNAAGAADPTWRMTNPVTGAQDTATYLDTGETQLNVKASPGIGTRLTMSALGEGAYFDVKDFSTTVCLEKIQTNIALLISLQTAENGTLNSGGVQGNGIHVMIRKAGENSYDWAVYEQKGDPAISYALGAGDLGENKNVTVKFHYDPEASSVIIQTDGTLNATVTNGPDSGGTLAESFAKHYAENNYKAWLNMSCYYFSPPANGDNDCVFILRDVNGKTPKAWHDSLVENAVAAFEAGVEGLNGQSSAEEIARVSALNVFSEGSLWNTLLQNAGGGLSERLSAAVEALKVYEQKTAFDVLSAKLDAFLAALENYDAGNLLSVRDARLAYEAISFDEVGALPAMYADQLNEKLDTCQQHENFLPFISGEADRFFASYESLIKGSDVSSYAEYLTLASAQEEWEEFAATNHLADGLSEEDLAALDSRAEELKRLADESFYSRFWREGETWRAELTENGIYATGEGDYGNTLGFNNKMTLGENASVTFNIIYARRDLGSNHLHIGFYPKTGTGTLGDTDGLRVDFWFSTTGVFEIRPVNGRTELPAFKGSAILSVDDTGFFDPEDPDFEVGKYTVEAYIEDGVVMIAVNGLAMPCEEISPDLFKDGAYLTISTMSYKGSDWNEIMITEAGGVNYVNYSPDTQKPGEGTETPGDHNTGTTEPSAKPDYTAVIALAAVDGVLLVALAVTVILLVLRRKNNKEEKTHD